MQLTPHQTKFLDRITKKFTQSFHLINTVSDRNKITVFGSARLKEDNPLFAEIEEFSKKLRADGWMMISGGGPGVMKAALNGTMNTKEDDTIAFQIDLQREQMQIDADLEIRFTDFFVRKYFLRESDVFIIAPGGFGTLDEVCEVLTLVQTGKLKNRRIIFYKKAYWQPLLDWFKDTLLQQGMIAAEDLHLYQVADTPEELVSLVNRPA